MDARPKAHRNSFKSLGDGGVSGEINEKWKMSRRSSISYACSCGGHCGLWFYLGSQIHLRYSL